MDAASLGALFGLSRGGLPSPCPSERHGGEIIQKGPPLPHFLTPLIKRRLKCAQGLRETAHFEILGNRSGEAAPNENDMRPPWQRTSTRSRIKNDNSIAKIARNLPPNIFGGLGFPTQAEQGEKAISLNVRFVYAKHLLFTPSNERIKLASCQRLILPHKNRVSRRTAIAWGALW